MITAAILRPLIAYIGEYHLMKQQGNFAEGSISKNILSMAGPLIIAELVSVIYNIVDRIYIGHIPDVGTTAFSGVGICLPLVSLVAAFASLSGMGGSPLFAIARGHGDENQAQNILETDFTMLISNAAILMLILIPLLKPILSVLGSDADTLPYAYSYMLIYMIGTPFVLVSIGMNPFINAQGYARIGMLTVIIGAVLNIILDPIFIFVLRLDVRGAALATIISQFVSAVWVLIFLLKRAPIKIKRLHIDFNVAKSVLKLGATGFTMKVTNSLTQAVINMTLKAWGGDIAYLYIASMSIISSIREVSWLPMQGFVEAYKPVASYNYGAHRYDRVKEAIRFVLTVNISVGLLMWCVIQFATEPLIRLFTADEVLIANTIPCMRAFFRFYFLMALMISSQNTFVALNMPKKSIFFSLNRKVILVVPLTIILPYFVGVMGAFHAEALSQLFGATLCFVAMILTVYRHLDNWEEYQAEKKARKNG